MGFLTRTCRDVAVLLVAREDRVIQIGDRIAVRMHLLACKTCPDFERQLLTMRQAMKQWRNYPGEDNEAGSAD